MWGWVLVMTAHSCGLTGSSSAGVRGEERGVPGAEHELSFCCLGLTAAMTVRGRRGEGVYARRGGGGGGLSRASRSSSTRGNLLGSHGTTKGEGSQSTSEQVGEAITYPLRLLGGGAGLPTPPPPPSDVRDTGRRFLWLPVTKLKNLFFSCSSHLSCLLRKASSVVVSWGHTKHHHHMLHPPHPHLFHGRPNDRSLHTLPLYHHPGASAR